MADAGDRDEVIPMRPVGVVRVSPHHDTVIQARYAPVERGVIELDPPLADALDGLDGFDFAWMLTSLDRAHDPRDGEPEALRPVPFLLAEYGPRVGVFASRYPHRPNRIGLSLVRIERVDGASVHFSGVDVIDGTPVLDLKPWISDFDLPPRAQAPGIRCGWFDTLESRPVTIDDPEALVLVARELSGRSAVVARTLRLDGLGATDTGEIALLDRGGVRAGRILSGAVDPALARLATDAPTTDGGPTGARVVELEIDDPSARRAGLTCGGRAQIVLQPLDQVPGAWWDAVARRQCVALVTDLDAPDDGSVVVDAHRTDAPVPREVQERAVELLAGSSTASTVVEAGTARYLIEAILPVPRLVVVGDAALAGDLVHLAGWLGWSAEQYADPDAAAVAVAALGPRDAVVVLDHGIARTGPLLASALASTVGYVGALGSRRTQAARTEHLRGLDVDPTNLGRLHGPTGLDLGATNRAEIAMSICAEITAERTHRSARPLRDTTGHVQG